MSIAEVLAIYAAIVSTTLAIVRLVEFRASRERLHFSVYAAEIFSADPTLKDKPRPEMIAIHAGNRAPFPLHITHIGFMLRRGTGLFSNPIPGQAPLPKKLEPSEGLTWLMLPDKLREALGALGVNEIAKVYAYDGSSRKYERRLTRGERKHLRPLLGPAPQPWWRFWR